LLNPLLADPNGQGTHFSIALSHYILLNEQKGHGYSYDVLSELIDNTLEAIAQKQNLAIDSNHDQGISWLDSVVNIDFLFIPPSLVDTNSSMFVVPPEPDKVDLKRKRQATNMLYKAFKKAGILDHIAAAYKVAEMPGQNFRELTPYQLYQALSGETSLRITVKHPCASPLKNFRPSPEHARPKAGIIYYRSKTLLTQKKKLIGSNRLS